jgi:hypothetical protein
LRRLCRSRLATLPRRSPTQRRPNKRSPISKKLWIGHLACNRTLNSRRAAATGRQRASEPTVAISKRRVRPPLSNRIKVLSFGFSERHRYLFGMSGMRNHQSTSRRTLFEVRAGYRGVGLSDSENTQARSSALPCKWQRCPIRSFEESSIYMLS